MNHRKNIPPVRMAFTLLLILIILGFAAHASPGSLTYAQSCVRISSGSWDGSIARASEVDCYTFNGSAGETVTIRMEAESGSDLDPYLELFDQDGRRLARDDDSGGGLNSLIEHTLPDAETYMIKARSYGGDSRGGYVLSLSKGGTTIRCSCDGDVQTGIGSVNATIPRSGSPCLCTFSGSEGDDVEIQMLARSSGLDPWLELRDPRGTTLDTDDDGAEGYNSLIEYELPSTGTYTVVATSYGGGSSGGFTLSVEGATGGASACGGDISYGGTRQDEITSAGGSCEYQFSGQRGDRVDIRMERIDSSLDPWLDLKDPNGRVLDSDDDGAGGRDSRIRYTLASSGFYTIVATSYQGGSAGEFELILSRESR